RSSLACDLSCRLTLRLSRAAKRVGCSCLLGARSITSRNGTLNRRLALMIEGIALRMREFLQAFAQEPKNCSCAPREESGQGIDPQVVRRTLSHPTTKAGLRYRRHDGEQPPNQQHAK